MRYTLRILRRGELLNELEFPTFGAVRTYVNSIKRNSPDLILENDIWIEDNNTGTEYSVDQDYNIIEM